MTATLDTISLHDRQTVTQPHRIPPAAKQSVTECEPCGTPERWGPPLAMRDLRRAHSGVPRSWKLSDEVCTLSGDDTDEVFRECHMRVADLHWKWTDGDLKALRLLADHPFYKQESNQ